MPDELMPAIVRGDVSTAGAALSHHRWSKQREREANLAAALADLEHARERAEPWYVWVRERRRSRGLL